MSFRLSRRKFLATSATAGAASAMGGFFMPSISRAADRPMITHGVQSGDVTANTACIWGRADRASRMITEIATTEGFKIRSASRMSMCCRNVILPASLRWRTYLPARMSFTRSILKTLMTHAHRPSRSLAISGPHRRRNAIFGSVGQATPPGRAGALMKTVAA